MSGWYVEVNEGILDATGRGAVWWYQRRALLEASGKLADTVAACVIGGRVEIGPFSHDDAAFMADHMTNEVGVPATAVRLKQRK